VYNADYPLTKSTLHRLHWL